jgi:hypothetical protein
MNNFLILVVKNIFSTFLVASHHRRNFAGARFAIRNVEIISNIELKLTQGARKIFWI